MKKIFSVLNVIIIFVLVYFATLGNDCQNLVNSQNGTITGDWQLVKMEGNLQDVCLGETAQFQSNNQAILTCPGKTALTRNYTYSSNILTYTETNVSYDVSFGTINGVYKMILSGRSIERVLTYDQLTK